ncbi:4Fe-4S binding protein [Buttiauxella izardii]|uniref:Ferredoxin n=1 Tax=Buttiauxella izardii TaxID=82991 RepID=A0A3A5JT09_9ENTR|nr:4Fe-4S binding protein [Buttiauxella izardii]RJT24092.1 ferredoxin [Buttiauxella izardii]
MKFNLQNTRSILVGVGRSCVHYLVAKSDCQACLAVCPSGAVILENGRVQIDTDACIACGACLFACPTAAIETPEPPRRYYRDTSLVMPLSVTPPTVDELLMWHAQLQIRAVEFNIALYPDWVVAIAALNLRLKKLKQPLWAIVPAQETAIDKGRRHWLQLKNGENQTGSVTPGRRARRASFPETSEYQVIVDKSRCFLCGACARICPEAAIQMDSESMVLNSTRCTSCGCCQEICLPEALKIVEEKQNSQTVLPLFQNRCNTCHRSFSCWSSGASQCPICQRHVFGMRES